MSHALDRAQNDFSNEMRSVSDHYRPMHYLLLSVQNVALCHQSRDGTFSYTTPHLLLNGKDTPSAAGIKLLLQGMACAAARPPPTRLHKLPPEIQDHILQGVSEGPIEPARFGCVMGLGSTYNWLRNDTSRTGGPIERLENSRTRQQDTPVETRISFGGTFSGLGYN